MDKTKKDQRRCSFNFTAKITTKRLKSSFLSIFGWQTRDNRSNRRAESSRHLKKGYF
ncbi:hypothetical protein COLO4_26966 [Corchorus olitorius]|uniref:Uncharacterized protein n=1 Tax=Corchorus olitorius TaxID=93759 RepID=A0A1R3HTI8_9ROSI|nr:hypothetical protein COLO4_26966 [Corchorus olitorius]